MTYKSWWITNKGISKARTCKHKDISIWTTESDCCGYTSVYDHKKCNDCKRKWLRNGD